MDLHIIKNELLEAYLNAIPSDLQEKFDALHDAEISTDTFSFYTSVSSVFSSKIEGEDIELDSYIKHKKWGISFQPDYTQKIDDLYNAYVFAQNHALTREHVAQAHALLSQHVLPQQAQGKYRTQNIYVSTPDGRIDYVAASPYIVQSEMDQWHADVDCLLNQDLSLPEVFFFASMIHLVFVKIHPWNDGNGRSARLLEKWFLGQKLGEKAWFIPSERHYYEQHALYYKHIGMLGFEYPDLDYAKALPFLLMLPGSIR